MVKFGLNFWLTYGRMIGRRLRSLLRHLVRHCRWRLAIALHRLRLGERGRHIWASINRLGGWIKDSRLLILKMNRKHILNTNLIFQDRSDTNCLHLKFWVFHYQVPVCNKNNWKSLYLTNNWVDWKPSSYKFRAFNNRFLLLL